METRYTDGSFASHIYPGTTARRNKTDGIAVRVIAYHLDTTVVAGTQQAANPDVDAESRTYRLLTTILDPHRGAGRRVGGGVLPTLGDRD